MYSLEQQNRLHPQKLMMWIAMGSMFMVFAGFTSAFILQKGGPTWVTFQLPKQFYISTLVIIASSFTMHKAVMYYKQNLTKQYKNYILFTIALGALFILLQLLGFKNLYSQNIILQGSSSNGFLYIICGLHILHMLAAIISLFIIYLIAFRKKININNKNIGIEIMSLFWHFVDGLWVYLFIFFCLNFKL